MLQVFQKVKVSKVLSNVMVKRGPMAHGSHFHRAPGSVGMASDASRVFKGQKCQVVWVETLLTVQNLEVVQVDTDNA